MMPGNVMPGMGGIPPSMMGAQGMMMPQGMPMNMGMMGMNNPAMIQPGLGMNPMAMGNPMMGMGGMGGMNPMINMLNQGAMGSMGQMGSSGMPLGEAQAVPVGYRCAGSCFSLGHNLMFTPLYSTLVFVVLVVVIILGDDLAVFYRHVTSRKIQRSFERSPW